MADTQISLHIDLAGLAGRMQRVLKATTNLVAIGLNAAPGITTDSFSIPDTPIQHQFDSNNPWSQVEAATAWRSWILRNGFRDAAEAVGGTLEEVQSVLSFWHLAERQMALGGLQGEDWNTYVVQRGQQFHRRTFPQRLEFLEKNYSFAFDPNLLDQINTINIARNCLAHRGGVVTELDLNSDGRLEIRWSALVALAMTGDTEVEIHPPHFVEAGTKIGISTRPKCKTFRAGQQLDFTALEFAQMCWTFFLFAQSSAERLEEYGRQRGMQIEKRAT